MTVQPESTAAGSYSVLTFRVPTESDTAGTTGLTVTLPTGTPFTSVRTEPIAGWDAEVVRGALPAPVDVQGATVTEAPLQVVWTAQDGEQVPPGQFQRFTVQVGPLPAEEGTEVLLPAVQTYSDGEQVAWDQPTPEGGEEPEHPAPVLVTTAAAGDAHHGTEEADEEPAAAAPATDDPTARLARRRGTRARRRRARRVAAARSAVVVMAGGRRQIAAAVAGGLLGLVAVVGISLPASAHNVLRSTTPAADSTVDAPPESVTLVFDEPAIAMGSVVEVTDPDGQVVSDGPVQLRDTSVVQPVVAGVAGTYQVVWRVTSGDGHPIEGTFAFTASSGAAAGPSSSGTPTAAASEPAVEASEELARGSGGPAPWVWAGVVVLVVAVVAGVTWSVRRGEGEPPGVG